MIEAWSADAIMTAHVFNARLDDRYPATLSRAVRTGIWREKLYFDGVIISDDMRMGAIAENCGLEEAVGKAIVPADNASEEQVEGRLSRRGTREAIGLGESAVHGLSGAG